MTFYIYLLNMTIIVTRYGLTPLHYAAMRGNDEAMQQLLVFPATDIEVWSLTTLTFNLKRK